MRQLKAQYAPVDSLSTNALTCTCRKGEIYPHLLHRSVCCPVRYNVMIFSLLCVGGWSQEWGLQTSSQRYLPPSPLGEHLILYMWPDEVVGCGGRISCSVKMLDLHLHVHVLSMQSLLSLSLYCVLYLISLGTVGCVKYKKYICLHVQCMLHVYMWHISTVKPLCCCNHVRPLPSAWYMLCPCILMMPDQWVTRYTWVQIYDRKVCVWCVVEAIAGRVCKLC